MGNASGQLRTVEEHRERPLKRATALDDGVHDRLVLGGHLVPARDGRQPRHDHLRLTSSRSRFARTRATPQIASTAPGSASLSGHRYYSISSRVISTATFVCTASLALRALTALVVIASPMTPANGTVTFG